VNEKERKNRGPLGRAIATAIREMVSRGMLALKVGSRDGPGS